MKASRWYTADRSLDDRKGLPGMVFEHVREVENKQSALYERFFRLSCLYDPYLSLLAGDGADGGSDRRVSENVIASNVDTVVGVVAAAEIRPRVLLDEGDWQAQRTATRLSWYGEGLGKLFGVHALGVNGFKDAALVGTGLVKVDVDWVAGVIRAERAMIGDVIVDEDECRSGQLPRQMHHRMSVDKEELAREYPDAADEIERAQSGANEGLAWPGYQSIDDEQIVAIESWARAIGVRGTRGYRAGRHTVCIDGTAVLDEEWHKAHFPFARMVWTERAAGWYGIGGAERIAGHQRRINKAHLQIDRQNDQLAFPTTFVRLPDAGLAVKTLNRVGAVAVYKADLPKTVIPQAVSPETYARLDRVRESAFEEFGMSRLAATAKKPGGLDSGAALREYRDQSTQRFAPQEKGFERFVLDILWLAVDCAKDLATRDGYSAPAVVKALARGPKKLRWADVDPGELRCQMQAASTLGRTPAGRTQMVLEWAQAGIVTQDEARRLLAPFDPLDLDKTMSLYTAALDNIDLTIEEVLDGAQRVPEPFQNLQVGVWRFQQAYLKAACDGAPDRVLEALRQWTVQAAFIVSKQNEQAAAQAAGVDGGALADMLPAPAMVPEGTPSTAIAPEARQIAGIG